MDPDDVRAITDYLAKGIYPLGLNRDDKRSLRQKATSFFIFDGRLYHRGKEGRKQLVICNADEKQQIIHMMHTEAGSRGGHNGMNTTIRKISEQYWWRRLVEDVRSFCKSCSICSHLTASNQRNTFPIPTEWPEELISYPEPMYVSAPVVEYKDMRSSSHATDLLQMLLSLYEQKICCDVILVAGRFQTQAHKVVLIASSGFFKSLLLDKDLPFNDAITLSNVSGPCLESLVYYLYSGTLRLNRENVQQVLDAATSLDISSAVELCQKFLHLECDNSQHQVEAIPSEPKGMDEKPVVKNYDDLAELELFIESEKLTSIKEENDTTVAEKKDKTTESTQSDYRESQRKFEPKAENLSSNSQKRKRSSDPSFVSVLDVLPPKRSRCRSRKMLEAAEEEKPQRRYATRSSTGTPTLKKRYGGAPSSLKPRSLLPKTKNVLALPEGANEKKASDTVMDTVIGKNSLFMNADLFRCTVCCAGFRLCTGLKLHYNQKHNFMVGREAVFWLARQVVDKARCSRSLGIQLVLKQEAYGVNESMYRCSACSMCFTLKSEALAHRMQFHSSYSSCRVKGCFKQFSTLVKLICHQRRKHAAVSGELGHPSSTKQSPVSHMSGARVSFSMTNSVAEDVFSISNKCGWCGQMFSSRMQLREHRQTIHRKPKLQETGEKKRRVQRDWNCKEKGCGLLFKTKDKLKAHMSDVHPSVVFSCPDCRFKTQVEQILLRHLVRRHRERHMCQLCGKAYHKPFLLRVHLFNRHKLSDPQLKLYHCQHEGCDYACPSKNGLNLHVLKHTSGSPFECNHCSKTFKRAIGLEKHISKIHLGIRPYICDKCGVSYGDESELKIHMTRHAENKPYSCTYCDYSTFQKGSLKSHLFCRHQVLMDQEMPVMKCDQCSFTTDKKCRFQDHVKMHRNIRDIPCTECGKMFVTKKTLRQHIIKVHRQKQLTCSFCPYSTAVQSKLHEHVRLQHAQQELNALFVDPSQNQLQQQLHNQQQCVNGIIPTVMHPGTEYQTLMPMESSQALGMTTDSSIVVGIPMSLDAYCFQTLDQNHLVL